MDGSAAERRARVITVFSGHGDRRQRALIRASLGERWFRAVCLELAASERPVSVRRWAHEAVAMMPGRDAAAATRAGLSSTAMSIRLHTVVGLASGRIANRVAWMHAALRDESGGVRVNALEALTRLRPRAIRSELPALLRDEKDYVRRAARRAAGGDADAARPRLLSGGNPQVAKGDGDGPVQAYIAAMPGWKRDAGRMLDALIVETVPGVRKAVRWNTPFYGVPGRGWFLGFHCFTRYVKVTFLNGAALRPLPPVGSKTPDVRYAHVHQGGVLDEDGQTGDAPRDRERLADWIRQAAALPGERLF